MELKGSSRIAGLGAYLPKQKVTTTELLDEVDCHRFGIPANYIADSIGIREKRVAQAQQLPSDLAVLASEQALTDAGVAADDIDLILFCGIDHDWKEPATAHYIQDKLGATHAHCLDITNACHGFMNGLDIADLYIANHRAQTVLVCTGERNSDAIFTIMQQMKKTHNKSDFKHWLGFLTAGDVGAAMVIQPATTTSGWKGFQFYSKGEHAKLCHYKYNQEGAVIGKMYMKEINLEHIRMQKDMIEQTYQRLNWRPEQIDKLYCHQVGTAPQKNIAQVAQVPVEKAPSTYEYLGNTTSATIPVTMALNPPTRGENVLFLGTGSGLTISQSGMVF